MQSLPSLPSRKGVGYKKGSAPFLIVLAFSWEQVAVSSTRLPRPDYGVFCKLYDGKSLFATIANIQVPERKTRGKSKKSEK